MRNANGIDMHVNTEGVTYVISAGNGQFYVYFGKDDRVTVTGEDAGAD